MSTTKKILLLFLLQATILESQDLQITSIYEILKTHPEIEYIKLDDEAYYEYKPTNFTEIIPSLAPYKGLMAETCILKIPNGQAVSYRGWVKIENHIIKESLVPGGTLYSHENWLKAAQKSFTKCHKIKGRVAVITTFNDICYGHWLLNILTRLALLEKQGIEYDYLYVAQSNKFQKETLALWGIDPAKIIEPFGDYEFIQADELIMPCQLGVRKPESWQYEAPYLPFERYENMDISGYKSPGFAKRPTDFIPESIPTENLYYRQYPFVGLLFHKKDTLELIRNKYVSLLDNNPRKKFSNKVFISRGDTGYRQCLNEQDVFKLFEEKGFTKYELAKMPYLDQVALFHGADVIVGLQGSGLLNIVYCKKDVTVVEIFQGFPYLDLFYLFQSLELKSYIPLKTRDFKFLDTNSYPIEIPIIQNFINTHDIFTTIKSA